MKPTTAIAFIGYLIILCLLAFCTLRCGSTDDHNPCTNIRVPCLIDGWDDYIEFHQFEWECNQPEYLYSDGETFKVNTWLMDGDGFCHEIWLEGQIDSCNEGIATQVTYLDLGITLPADGGIWVCDDILWWWVQ